MPEENIKEGVLSKKTPSQVPKWINFGSLSHLNVNEISTLIKTSFVSELDTQKAFVDYFFDAPRIKNIKDMSIADIRKIVTLIEGFQGRTAANGGCGCSGNCC